MGQTKRSTAIHIRYWLQLIWFDPAGTCIFVGLRRTCVGIATKSAGRRVCAQRRKVLGVVCGTYGLVGDVNAPDSPGRQLMRTAHVGGTAEMQDILLLRPIPGR